MIPGSILLREEELATATIETSASWTTPGMLFRLADVVQAMRARLLTLDAPATLESFVPRVLDVSKGKALVARCALSSTLIAALELTRVGEAILLQEDARQSLLIESATTSLSVGPSSGRVRRFCQVSRH